MLKSIYSYLVIPVMLTGTSQRKLRSTDGCVGLFLTVPITPELPKVPKQQHVIISKSVILRNILLRSTFVVIQPFKSNIFTGL